MSYFYNIDCSERNYYFGFILSSFYGGNSNFMDCYLFDSGGFPLHFNVKNSFYLPDSDYRSAKQAVFCFDPVVEFPQGFSEEKPKS